MSAGQAPFVRVYYSIVDDPKFDGIYDDDHHLAAWLRLLLTHDGTFPAPAPVPASARRASFDALVKAGIVDPVHGGRYRIHGLDAERARQSARGKAGADARWGANAMRSHSEGNASASSHAMLPLPPLSPSTARTRGDRKRSNGSHESTPLGIGDATDQLRRHLKEAETEHP